MNTRAHPRAGRPGRWLAGGVGLMLAAGLAACSGEDAPATRDDSGEVVLVTHDSFSLPDELVSQFRKDTGYELIVRASGDAGALSAKLALTKDNPTGDVAFGIDNTFASRTLEEGVFAEYADSALAPGSERYALPEGTDRLKPVDVAHVCINVDDTYFAGGRTPPRTLEDLTKPAYRDLFVTPAASTSSPGMAFLLSTIAAFGDDWRSYWEDLVANGAKIVDGWSDAYYSDFTQGGEGDRPIVLSYDSSPAFTVPEDSEVSATSALLDTCFRQVEYAGVLAGADNPEGAQAFVDFLTGPDVQEALPESMYVFPVSEEAELPPEWERHATQPDEPFEVDPELIAEERETWLQEWTEIISR